MNDEMNESVNDATEQTGNERSELLEDALSGGPSEAAYRNLPVEDRVELIRDKFSSLIYGSGQWDDAEVHDLCSEFFRDWMEEAAFIVVAQNGIEESFFEFVEDNLSSSAG